MNKTTIMLAAALTFFACSKEESCTLFGKCDEEPSCVVGASGYAGEYIRFTDARDGKEYKSVVIGRQAWMAENLNYEAEGSRCYDNDPAKCEAYGRLYDWNTAMTACPLGWHLPTEDELWDILNVYIIERYDGDEYVGKRLKWVSGWDNDCNGSDAFGFAALPGGFSYGGNTPTFYGVGGSGNWWLVTEYDCRNVSLSDCAHFYNMEDSDGYLNKDYHPKTDLYSVRCVKDEMQNPSSSSKGNNPSSSSTPAPDAGSFTDSRDGQTYRTVQIGSQTWMAENLNYNAAGSKCYNNSASNCSTYGRLYDWATAMGFFDCGDDECNMQRVTPPHKGICPSGWHIPNKADWNALITFAGGESTAGTKLKARSGWNGGGNGTDSYGFSALPGGTGISHAMLPIPYFELAGDYGYWRSADEYGSYVQSICYNEDGVGGFDIEKEMLMSVRCLKDKN